MKHLIELKNVSKTYVMGMSVVKALRDVSLTIAAGEFVAIMGASGSGKSTLLNMLGFLDVPDSGTYSFIGKEVTRLGEDELSVLRNNVAGFVFQQFQLLPRLSARDNVLLPTLYAGKRNMESSAADRLSWVGLSHRIDHFPNELSGGEQQRVAIARSMINDPVVVFADEPTGNLDTKSEEEIIDLLKKMNSEGKTIVMVTHENEIARHASRIIRMKDGEIISDKRSSSKQKKNTHIDHTSRMESVMKKVMTFARAEFVDYVRQAAGSIISHKMRSLLSILGILIGVASVISMLAIGQGAKDSIEKSMSSLGSNVVTVMPGVFRPGGGGGALQAGSVTRFSMQDASAMKSLAGVRGVSPNVNGRVQVVYGDKNCNTQLSGVGTDYQTMKAAQPIAGRFFTPEESTTRARVALIGATVLKNLFGNENPVGKTVKINRVNFTVIGILPVKGMTMMRDQDDIVVVPVNTAMYRLLGKKYVDTIDVEVTSPTMIDATIETLKSFIVKRNRAFEKENSFEIMDMSEIRKTMMSTTNTMSMLLGAVAVIALIVGGVGVMNIMLVSVRERTREIGLRKAVGGRRKDILVQFLVEAVMMTCVGGVSGIVIGVSISMLITLIAGWAIKISILSILGATFFSVIIGLGFGIWPAMQASRLNPIEALRSE